MVKNSDDGGMPPITWPRPAGGPDGDRAVPKIEGYELTGTLGHGGMGTVWSAVQLSTRRDVALKLLGRGAFASERERARFEREVELSARLQHPNIAQIYESGLHLGVYYYAMELIEGVPLDRYVEEEHFTQRQILELMGTVCQAIQHAHERGIIHRDLKPSNILVTPDGKPHVLDFGLAKAFLEGGSDLSVSADGEAAGTPAFMSPEQAAGHRDQVDTRTDVYSLGVILFRLLTGETPHDLSGTRYELLRRIAEEEIRRPREITKEVDRELEALLLKALAHDPKGRYASAGALAQDIENYLTAEPLIARPPTTTYFLRKRIWKYRVPVGIGLSILCLLLGMAIFAYVRVSDERTKAVAARNDLQKEADKARAVHDFLRETLIWSDPLADEVREGLDRAAKKVETQFGDRPDVEAAVRTAVGQVYLFLGRLEEAETQFRRAFEIRRQLLGEENTETIDSMRFLSVALGRGSKFDEWENMLRRLSELDRRVLGAEHPDTLSHMFWLSVALWVRGSPDEAVEVVRQCLEIRCRVLGEDHPDTLQSMVTLSFFLEPTGKLDEAEAWRRKKLEIHLRTLGEEHPHTVGTMSYLANFLERRGRLEEAEAWRKKALEILLRVHGEEHIVPRDLRSDEGQDAVGEMNRLVALLWRRDKLDEAEAMNRRILEIRRRVQGKDHQDTLSAMSNLAALLEERGKLEEAEALHKEELAIRKDLCAQKALERGPTPPAAGSRAQGDTLAYDGFDAELTLAWQILNPDHSHVSLTENPGTLKITTQDGGLSESNRDYKNLFLIDCPAPVGEDFQLTTCISRFDPVSEWNQAGLIVYNDDDNYLTFVRQRSLGAGKRLFTIDAETEGGRSNVIFRENHEFEKVWLRIEKRGNRYTFSTSFDGKHFVARSHPEYDYTGVFQRGVAWGDGSVGQVGLIAINGSRSTAPEVDASFDFFEVRSLPAGPVGEVASPPGEQSDAGTP